MNESQELTKLIEVQNYHPPIWEEFLHFVFYPDSLSILLYCVFIALIGWACWKRNNAIYCISSFWVVSFGGFIAVNEMISSFNGSHNYFDTGIPELKLACSALGFSVRSSLILLLSTLIYRPTKKSLLKESYSYLRPMLAIWLGISLDGITLLLLLFYGI